MTANVTFMPFLCCHLITSRDRPYKVYISLKLRAFYIHFKKENHCNSKCACILFTCWEYMQNALSFKKMYTLWGLSCLGVKVEQQKWSNVSFIVIFLLKVSCILKAYQRLKFINKNKIFKHLHSSNFVINHKRNSHFTLLWYFIKVILIHAV